MTDPKNIFRFAVDDGPCCEEEDCTTCVNNDPPDEFQIDATAIALVDEECDGHCDEYSELTVAGQWGAWTAPYCERWTNFIEDPQRCSQYDPPWHRWEVTFNEACAVRVRLMIVSDGPYKQSVDAYVWFLYPVARNEDYSDWVTIPWRERLCVSEEFGSEMGSCYEYACQDVDPGDVRIKRV